MRGKRRCRFHCGLSTGPRTEAGKERIRREKWQHGGSSAAAVAMRKEAVALIRQLRAMLRAEHAIEGASGQDGPPLTAVAGRWP